VWYDSRKKSGMVQYSHIEMCIFEGREMYSKKPWGAARAYIGILVQCSYLELSESADVKPADALFYPLARALALLCR